MSAKKICRICLCTNIKVYHYESFQLKHYYEQITCLKGSDSDGLPPYFCYECAAMLYKCYKFQQKCFLGREALKLIQVDGGVKFESVLLIDRPGLNLNSPLQILETSERVKTYIIKHNAVRKKDALPKQVKTKQETVIEISDTKESNVEVEIIKTDLEIEYDDNDTSRLMESEEHDSDNEPLIKINKECINDFKPKEEVFVATVENITQLLDFETSDLDVVYDKPKIEEDLMKIVRKSKRKKITGKKKREKIEKMYENSKFFKRRKRNLDPVYWKKYNLSEDDALKEFEAKAQCKKYLAARYKCADCFKPFLVEETLSRHKELIHKEALGPEECRFCRMRFKWRCYLSRHIQKHYTRFQCQRCSFVCNVESTAYLHEETHSDVKIKCKYCDEEFRHRSTYYTHLRTHRSEHVCEVCGASFVSQAGLHMHKRLKHVAEDLVKVKQKASSIFCEKCDITFDSQMAYEAHLLHSAMHPGGEGGIPNDKAPDEEMHNLKLNKKRGSRRKPTTCYQCGKHFDSQTACFKHHLMEHPGTSFNSPEERQICEFCGASLAPGSVANHLNSHTRSRLHTCDTCGRQFSTKMVLKRHLLTHTGEKPFACTLCEKRFTQPSSLHLHFRTCHLKQPYPKRNRKRKTDIDDFRMELESEGSR